MIVAIDAASSDLSLSLATPDGAVVGEQAWTSLQRQSAELLPRLLDLLARHETGVRDVSALAIGTGPGSFTGLRVSMALAKGLAHALQCRLYGFPSLAAWLDAEPDADAAVARAGAREAYLLPRGTSAPVVVERDELAARLGGVRFVAPAELVATFGLDGAARPRGAIAMAAAAAVRLAAGDPGDDLATLEPIYLRAPRGVAVEVEGRVTWL
jgi:tRNA threonylcarbamoyl adenosine modification protein YeaZ